MRTSELTSVNLVLNRKGESVKISLEGLHILSDWEFDKYSKEPPFEPIPLTEEWLLRLGFYETNDLMSGAKYSIESGIIDAKIENGIVIIGVCLGQYAECAVWLNHIKYVHQVQNLYLSLIGKELELK